MTGPLSNMTPILAPSDPVGLLQWNKPIDFTLSKKFGENALTSAIMRGHLPVVQKILCQPKIDLNGWSTQHQPPILVALDYQRHDILKILLQDPRIDILVQNGRGYTALHLAIIYDDLLAFKMLLNHPHIDIDHIDKVGNSPLLLAAMTYDGLDSRRDTMLDILMSQSAILVSIQDHRGRSVLWHAANTGNKRLMLQLAQLPDLESGISDENGVTPLEQARKRGHLEIVAFLESMVTVLEAPRRSILQ